MAPHASSGALWVYTVPDHLNASHDSSLGPPLLFLVCGAVIKVLRSPPVPQPQPCKLCEVSLVYHTCCLRRKRKD
jgi:hypothetical protein